MRKFLTAKDSLLTMSNRREYCFEITGEAKKQIISAISSVLNCEIEEPENLWFDFRDVMLLSLVFQPIVTAYDIQDQIREWIWVALIGENQFNPDDWFTDQAMQCYEFLCDVVLYNNFPEDFWQTLKTCAEEVAKVSSPETILDLKDVFKEGTLTVKNLDKILKTVDDVLKIIVEIYDFEKYSVYYDGSRKDGREPTLWTIFCEASFRQTMRFSSWAENQIPDPPSDTVLKIGSLSIKSGTSIISLLKELERVLPNGKLTIEVATNSEPYSSFSVEIDLAQFYKPQIDFRTQANIGTDLEVFDYLVTHSEEIAQAFENVTQNSTVTNEDLNTFNNLLAQCRDSTQFLDDAFLNIYTYSYYYYYYDDYYYHDVCVILMSGQATFKLSGVPAIKVEADNSPVYYVYIIHDFLMQSFEQINRLYKLYIASRRLGNLFESFFNK
ncbi:MAG: hypothetical protein WHT65_04780 [Pseudothermotoga sp.]